MEVTDVLSAPTLVCEHRDGEWLLISPRSGRWFRTSELGHWFIERCDGAKPVEAICQELARQSGILVQQAQMLLEPFVDSALRQGFLQASPSYVYPELTPPQELPLESLNTVWIHGTLRCNLNCFFCYSNSGERNSPELTPDDIERLVTQIPHPERVGFQISGGEPFLWPHLAAALRVIKAAGGMVTVLTNGTLGSRADYEAIMPYVDMIQFSIDGVSSEAHDRHRGAGAFDQAMSRIALAKELGVKALALSFTPSRYNIGDLPGMLELTERLEGATLHVNRLMPIGRGKKTQETFAAPDEEYLAAMDALVAAYRAHVNRRRQRYTIESMKVGFDPQTYKLGLINLDIAGDQSRKVVISACRTTCGTATMLSIDADGAVYSCPSLHLPELRLGHIRENPLREMWEVRKPFLSRTQVDALPACRDCDYRYICGGGCRALAYAVTGDIGGQDPMCHGMKEAIVNCMWALQP